MYRNWFWRNMGSYHVHENCLWAGWWSVPLWALFSRFRTILINHIITNSIWNLDFGSIYSTFSDWRMEIMFCAGEFLLQYLYSWPSNLSWWLFPWVFHKLSNLFQIGFKGQQKNRQCKVVHWIRLWFLYGVS